MLNEERQRAILEVLRRDGRVLVVDLAKQFHTSPVTIRKDLEILDVQGRIQTWFLDVARRRGLSGPIDPVC